MTQYDATFDAPVMFPPQSMNHLLGQVVAAAGKHQLRMAETEKYPHVTYFFNGGVETPNPGRGPRHGAVAESRDLRSAARDERDSADRRSHRAARHRQIRPAHPQLREPRHGRPHRRRRRPRSRRSRRSTRASSAWWKKCSRSAAACLITADHGNCEREINDDGTPNTAHTTNLVQFIYAGPNADKAVHGRRHPRRRRADAALSHGRPQAGGDDRA